MRGLALLSIAWIVGSATLVACGYGFNLALETTSGVTILSGEDLEQNQRLAIVAILSLPSFCWLWNLIQVVMLSRLFATGQILTRCVVNNLIRFAWGLIALGLCEFVSLPLLDQYLQGIGKIDPMKHVFLSAIGSGFFESLMAGALVIVLAKVLDSSIVMRQEMELTV